MSNNQSTPPSNQQLTNEEDRLLKNVNDMVEFTGIPQMGRTPAWKMILVITLPVVILVLIMVIFMMSQNGGHLY